MVQHITNPQYYINLVVGELMEPDERRLKALQIQLIQENAALGGKRDGFFYRGHVMYNVDPKLYMQASKGSLDPSLYEKAELIVRQLNKTKTDGDGIRQYMALCFILITNPQTLKFNLPDLRDMLHDGVVDLIPELREFQRTRPEEYCMQEQFRKQWEKKRALVEEYIAMRFFIT